MSKHIEIMREALEQIHGTVSGSRLPTCKIVADALSALQAHEQEVTELVEALTVMEHEKSDYMIRNNLGDPSREHTNKMARAALRPFTGDEK